MAKGIPVKEAIKKWEAATGLVAAEAVEVKLNGYYPPIDKLDASLSTLASCEKLLLSTNALDKLSNLQGLSKLKILSIGRNLLKNLGGIEILAETLEELWASYNNIEKIKPISSLKKLKVLYFSNNGIKDVNELKYLAELPLLETIVITGNPIQTALGDEYRTKVADMLPNIKKLDGYTVIPTEKPNVLPSTPSEEQTLVSKVHYDSDGISG